MEKELLKGSKGLVILIFIGSLTFHSCMRSGKLVEEVDLVRSSNRISYTYTSKPNKRKSPLHSVKQTIVKEIKVNEEAIYKVYDVLYQSVDNFNLEDEVYHIYDDEVFTITLGEIENANLKTKSPISANMPTSDSTSMSVITGYNELNSKISKFNYTLTQEMVNKLTKARKMKLRYYAGPNMFTVEIKENNLEKLKSLIAKE